MEIIKETKGIRFPIVTLTVNKDGSPHVEYWQWYNPVTTEKIFTDTLVKEFKLKPEVIKKALDICKELYEKNVPAIVTNNKDTHEK